MRLVITRVLPEPAPAKISSGPRVWSTASRCSGLSASRNCMMTRRGGACSALKGRPRLAPTFAERSENAAPLSCLLFYRDALREIARLIDVAAAPHGYVVRQKLQRYDHEDRRQHRRRLRDLDDEVARSVEDGRKLSIARRRDRN